MKESQFDVYWTGDRNGPFRGLLCVPSFPARQPPRRRRLAELTSAERLAIIIDVQETSYRKAARRHRCTVDMVARIMADAGIRKARPRVRAGHPSESAMN